MVLAALLLRPAHYRSALLLCARDYCSYFHEDYQVFSTPEARVLHFVERASNKNWEWRSRWRDAPEGSDGQQGEAPPVYPCSEPIAALLITVSVSLPRSVRQAPDRLQRLLL